MPKGESCSAKARGWTRGAHLGFGLRLAISTRKLRHMKTCNKEYLGLVSQVVLPSFELPAIVSVVWLFICWLDAGLLCARSYVTSAARRVLRSRLTTADV